jgi:RES domain-containing protein
MITAWRLCNKRFAEPTGEGARVNGGRWNPKGYAVVYSSECLPLATLEALVHTRRRPNDQVYIQVSFEEALVQEVEALYLLPAGWNRDETATQKIGAKWVDGGSSAVLSVPSAVVSIARNYLINPQHPAFPSVLCSGTTAYSFDDRLINPAPAGP